MDYYTGKMSQDGSARGRVWKKYVVGGAVAVAVIGFIIWGGRGEEGQDSINSQAAPEFTALSRSAPRAAGTFPAPVFTSDDPVRGSADAPVIIVEFSDFECPFCRQAFPIIKELLLKYPHQVRIQYRDFPITDVHPDAFLAAEAAECASAQGKFWEYHDLLFENQGNLGRESLTRYAIEAGLNLAAFNTCLDGRTKAQEVEDDFNAGVALGVGGTPTWFINGVKYEGVLSLDEFSEIIKGLLR